MRSVPAEYRRRGYRHAAAWGFYGAFAATVVGLGPFVIRELGGSAFQCLMVNLAQALSVLAAVFCVPFVEGRNPARLTGLVMGAGGLILMFAGLADPTWPLAIVLFAGVVLAMLHRPVLGTALEQVYPRRWRGKLMSLPNTMAMLAQMLCLVFVARYLRADIEGYRWAFPAAGACLLISGLLFRGMRGSRGLRPTGPVGAPLQRVGMLLSSMFRNRPLLIFLTGYFITTCGAVLTVNVLPLFAKDEMQLTTAQWGLARAGFMMAALLSFHAWGAFMDRFGAPATVMLSWLLQCGLFLALCFVRTWPAFFVAVALRGFFQSGNILAFYPLVMHFTAPSETTRGMALHQLFWGVRWLSMALLGAWLVDAHVFPTLRHVFVIAAGCILLGVLVMFSVGRTGRPEGGGSRD